MAVSQVMHYESVNVKESTGLDPATLSPADPREKWLRKRTQVKLRVCACQSRTVAGTAASGRWGCPWGPGHPQASEGFGLLLGAHCSTCWGSCLDEAHGAALREGSWLGGYVRRRSWFAMFWLHRGTKGQGPGHWRG